MNRKIVFVFLIFSLSSNCLSLMPFDWKAKARVATSNSQLFDSAAMISAHSTALDDLIKDSISLFPEFKPLRSQNKTNNSNKDIISNNFKLELTQNTQKNAKTEIVGDLCHIFLAQVAVHNKGAPFPANLFICMFLLSYLVVLSRSNLPFEIIGSYVQKPNYVLGVIGLFSLYMEKA